MLKSTKSTKNCNILLQISHFFGSYSYHEYFNNSIFVNNSTNTLLQTIHRQCELANETVPYEIVIQHKKPCFFFLIFMELSIMTSLLVIFCTYAVCALCILSEKITLKSTKNCNILLQITNFSGSYSYIMSWTRILII